jgi:transposase
MHKQGENRGQLFMFSLESSIAADSFVRVLDAFVEAIDIKSFGFAHVDCSVEGRPPYHPAVLLKLYIYGYRYGIRSARKLEREAQTNLEAMWLLSGLRPRYKTIADFRKNHGKAFREVFRRFVLLLKEWNLVEGETVAIDSFKIRGSNSIKNNFNDKKLQRHLEYIDSRIAEYEQQLSQSEAEEEREELGQKIEKRRERREKYEKVKETLSESDQEQISLTDPDSRAVILHRNIVNVGYNVQASVDAKHKLLTGFDTGDVNDTHALADMAIATQELLQSKQMNVIADKGYHTGEEIQRCMDENITTFVSPRSSSSNNKDLFPVESFIYNKETDIYICPAGKQMTTNCTWHHHNDGKSKKEAYRFKRYITGSCKTCKQKALCTQSKKNGRAIDRSEYADALEANNARVNQNPGYYRQRQAIIEHVFGTQKRQRGFTHALVRGKNNVLGEVGLMFIGYNLTRCITILGAQKLIKQLLESYLHIFDAYFRLISSCFKQIFFQQAFLMHRKNRNFEALTLSLIGS